MLTSLSSIAGKIVSVCRNRSIHTGRCAAMHADYAAGPGALIVSSRRSPASVLEKGGPSEGSGK
jgi:hypothetical protein